MIQESCKEPGVQQQDQLDLQLVQVAAVPDLDPSGTEIRWSKLRGENVC